MCTVCGCGQGETKIEGEAHTHTYVHAHEQGSLVQGHSHAHASRMVQVEQDILAKNNQYASANRSHFAEHGIFVLNLVATICIHSLLFEQGMTFIQIEQGAGFVVLRVYSDCHMVSLPEATGGAHRPTARTPATKIRGRKSETSNG